MIRHTRRRPASTGSCLGGLLVAAILVGCAVAGCTPAPVAGAESALTLQSQVRAVSEAAAAHDPASTLKLLDELVIKLDRAATAGDITFQRYQSIMAAISALRTELTAVPPVAPVAAPPATAAPEAEPVPEAAAPAAVQPAPVIPWAPAAPVQAAAAPLPAPAPVAQAAQVPARTNQGKALGKLKGNKKG